MSQYRIVEQWAYIDDLWRTFLTHTQARRPSAAKAVGLSLQELHEELQLTRGYIPRPKIVMREWGGFARMSRGVSHYVLDKLEAEIVATARGKPKPDFTPVLRGRSEERWLGSLHYLFAKAISLRTDMAGVWQSLWDLEARWSRDRLGFDPNVWRERLEEVEELLQQAKILRILPAQINKNSSAEEPKLAPHQVQALNLYLDTVLIEPLEALVQAIRIHYGAEAGAFHGLPERGRP